MTSLSAKTAFDTMVLVGTNISKVIVHPTLISTGEILFPLVQEYSLKISISKIIVAGFLS